MINPKQILKVLLKQKIKFYTGVPDTTLKGFITELMKLKSISPEALLNTSDLDLKECGLSKQKISYLKGLALNCVNKEINFKELHKLDDELLIEEITRIKGIVIIIRINGNRSQIDPKYNPTRSQIDP